MATTTTQPTAVDWWVTITTPSGMLTRQDVTAAYFTETGRLTILKDDQNQAVYAVVTDSLVSIERKPEA